MPVATQLLTRFWQFRYLRKQLPEKSVARVLSSPAPACAPLSMAQEGTGGEPGVDIDSLHPVVKLATKLCQPSRSSATTC